MTSASAEWGPPTLIASDVDGTLIDHNDVLTERTRRVLERARARDVELVLATGRPPRWIPQISDQLANTPAAVRYAVCANGAIVYDLAADKVLHVQAFEPEAIRILAAMVASTIDGAGLAAERAATISGGKLGDAVTAPFVATAGYEHAWLNPDHVEVSDEHLFAAPAVKVLARKPGMSSREMSERLKPVVGDLAEVTFSIDTGLIELSVPNVHKAAGLQWLVDNTDVNGDAIIAFGDMPNDVDMLTWADRGVAMGHGDPAAHSAADEIAESNVDDGVAQVLERWF